MMSRTFLILNTCSSGACLLNFQSGHTSWIFDVHFDKKRIIRYINQINSLFILY